MEEAVNPPPIIRINILYANIGLQLQSMSRECGGLQDVIGQSLAPFARENPELLQALQYLDRLQQNLDAFSSLFDVLAHSTDGGSGENVDGATLRDAVKLPSLISHLMTQRDPVHSRASQGEIELF